jgi:conjugal transfer pilus assembly protein TraD
VRLDLLNSYGSLAQVATRVTNMIPPSKNEEFKMFAWRAVFNIVQALTLMGEKLSLVKIRECIQHDMSYLVQRAGAHYFAKHKETMEIAKKIEDEPDRKKAADMVVTVYNSMLSKKYPSKEMESLFGLYGQDQKHYQKLIQTIIPILVQLTSGVFKELLSPDPASDDPRPIISLKTVARTRGVLYLNLASLSDPETGASLGSFLLNDSINLVADRYYYKNEVLDDAVLNFFIDEASDVFNRSAISLLNKSRGSKAAITVMLQSAVNDIEYRMGDSAAAEVTLGNLNTKVQMRATDTPTQEYMSTQCGETTIAQIDYDHRTQSTASQSLDFNTSYAKTVSHTEVPLVPPEAFLDLPNLHFFIIGDSNGVQKVRVPYVSVPPEEGFKEPPFTDSPFGLLPGFSELIDVKTSKEHIPFESADRAA